MDDDAIWARARRRGLNVARRYTRDPSEAEDVVQEALLRAWRKRGSLRDEERFFQWVATIVRHEAARMGAKPRPQPADAIEVEAWGAAEALRFAEDRADLERGLAELTEGDRVLIRMRYEDDLTQAAIARALALPEGTVKVRLHRARAKLHRALSRK